MINKLSIKTLLNGINFADFKNILKKDKKVVARDRKLSYIYSRP